ncbi:hypothetical protein FTX61_10320 [Nitriliruptoraceae bacterium ZYF776]|nr:hypothetical protein [Profundirhabdus halotolerans]
MSDLTDDRLAYPEQRVVGVLPDADAIPGLLDDLADAGIDRGSVEVYRGPGDADQVDVDTDEDDGVLTGFVRTVQKAFGDEAERLRSLNDALEAGHQVVTVPVPEEGDDEDAQRAERQRIADVMHAKGARDVAYYGKWAITQLEAGAS